MARHSRDTTGRMKTAERKKLDSLEKRIHAMLDRGESLSWDVGKAFDEIARSGMHLDAGYPSLEAYADDRFEEGYRTLKRDRRVALAFSKRTVVKHGLRNALIPLTTVVGKSTVSSPAKLSPPAGGIGT